MQRKLVGLAAAAMASTLVLAGCSPASSGGSGGGDATDETLTMWVIGSDTPMNCATT